jgi:uncharacterized repeat protein (TIGR04138 family)
MPPTERDEVEKLLEQVIVEVGLYPRDAYIFVQDGLGYTVNKIHGGRKKTPNVSRHVTGRDLCNGLREFALQRWGLMAPAVLDRWNVRRTLDFGKIVFALVDKGLMQKTEEDELDDFRDVYDFKSAFEAGYRIEMKR